MGKNCYVKPINKTASDDLIRNADSALLLIRGMGCQNCATRVRNSLLSLVGVYTADVYLNMAMAEVVFDNKRITTLGLVTAVSGAGNDGRHQYHAELIAS